MKLHFRELGTGSPVIILHGLFGSSANWLGHARRLSDSWRLLVPDLRNHGRSPWASSMSLREMADDVIELLDSQQLPRATLAGHSLGGRVAMQCALDHPDRISRLAVFDMAPADYPNRFDTILQQLLAIDPAATSDRLQLEAAMATIFEDEGERQLIMMNLARDGDHFAWRLNLPAIRAAVGDLMRFRPPPNATFGGPALFLHGADSSYVRDEHRAAIRSRFPGATRVSLKSAGHWLHIQQPEAFEHTFRSWLRQTELRRNAYL